jgi:hypothetical protein
MTQLVLPGFEVKDANDREQALIKEIKAHLASAEKSADKAEQQYQAVGLKLRKLKALKPANVNWRAYVKQHFDIGKTRARELMLIADGRTTLDKVRADAKQRMKTIRNRRRSERSERRSRSGCRSPTVNAVPMSRPAPIMPTSPVSYWHCPAAPKTSSISALARAR